jgi:hypothetical protein
MPISDGNALNFASHDVKVRARAIPVRDRPVERTNRHSPAKKKFQGFCFCSLVHAIAGFVVLSRLCRLGCSCLVSLADHLQCRLQHIQPFIHLRIGDDQRHQ